LALITENTPKHKENTKRGGKWQTVGKDAQKACPPGCRITRTRLDGIRTPRKKEKKEKETRNIEVNVSRQEENGPHPLGVTAHFKKGPGGVCKMALELLKRQENRSS